MEKETERYAMVTAKVWVGSALFRNEPEKFLLYRDSILKENSVSSEEMRKYLEIYQSKSEKYERFTEMVSEYVDSLCLINEKLLSVDSMLDIDSVEGEPGS